MKFVEENTVMDAKDRVILSALERDARASYKAIGDRAQLSPNAVADRVRRLQERGTITQFSAEIHPSAFGLSLRALIEVKMESRTTADEFKARAAATPGVIRAFVTTGQYDWLLEVVARDQRDLQRIIEELRAGGLLRDTYSRIIASDLRFPLLRD